MVGNIKKSQKGFTIVEVMIVLAIAGLIMLVVLLAVPALQRNSRNTRRRSDVSAITSALQETINNSNGQLPATCASGCGFSNNAKLGFYDKSAGVSFTKNTTAVTALPAASEDKIVMNSYTKCDDAGTGFITSGASTRSITAVFYVETASATQVQCVDI